MTRFSPIGCIYLLTFANGKQYVGATQCWERRWNEHRWSVKSSKYAMYAAWRELGAPQVTFLSTPSVALLNQEEQKFIEVHNTVVPRGYNITRGGKGTSGWCPSDQWKEKIRKVNLGRTHSPEWRRRLSESRKQLNIKLSDEQKEHLRNALKGRKRPPRSQAWIDKLVASRKANGTYRTSPETKAKISASLRRRFRCV